IAGQICNPSRTASRLLVNRSYGSHSGSSNAPEFSRYIKNAYFHPEHLFLSKPDLYNESESQYKMSVMHLVWYAAEWLRCSGPGTHRKVSLRKRTTGSCGMGFLLFGWEEKRRMDENSSTLQLGTSWLRDVQLWPRSQK